MPQLAFGEGATATLRLLPDKLPIGVDRASSRYVFLFLMTGATPRSRHWPRRACPTG